MMARLQTVMLQALFWRWTDMSKQLLRLSHESRLPPCRRHHRGISPQGKSHVRSSAPKCRASSFGLASHQTFKPPSKEAGTIYLIGDDLHVDKTPRAKFCTGKHLVNNTTRGSSIVICQWPASFLILAPGREDGHAVTVGRHLSSSSSLCLMQVHFMLIQLPSYAGVYECLMTALWCLDET